MAAFLLKTWEGDGYTPPACTVATFTDVPCSNPFAAWIYELVARNITAGCGNGQLLPAATANRGQMATFLVKTFSPCNRSKEASMRRSLALLIVFQAASAAAAATFTVTNTNDSGAGSLREAITQANNNAGLDTIAFNVSGAGCAGSGSARSLRRQRCR